MKLRLLIDKMDIVKIVGDLPDEISGLTDVSYKIKNDWAFFCVKGSSTDGRNFVKEVELLGGTLIVTENDFQLHCVKL